MQTTFTHRLLIAIIAGFALACAIEFYKTFIAGADEALNKGYQNRYSISAGP